MLHDIVQYAYHGVLWLIIRMHPISASQALRKFIVLLSLHLRTPVDYTNVLFKNIANSFLEVTKRYIFIVLLSLHPITPVGYTNVLFKNIANSFLEVT